MLRVKYLVPILFFSLLAASSFTYFSFNKQPIKVGEKILLEPTASSQPTNEVPYKVEEFVGGLYVPWAMVFTSSQRALVTERNGSVRVVSNGNLTKNPLITFSEVSNKSEEGLMGMALHSDYQKNKQVYVCLAYEDTGEMKTKVVRFRDGGNKTSDLTTILDGIPAAQYHAGCELSFGPDGFLYITTGDATDKNLAQDKYSLAGKILRVKDDGSLPDDNPIPGTFVYSLGHRNPQGIAWHPVSKVMYSAEHGPTLFDGPAGGDEINVIEKGKNYGWPKVSHEKSQEGLISPVAVFTPAIAPSSISFYKGKVFPQFRNNLFVAMLKGEGLMRVIVKDDAVNGSIVSYEKMAGVDVGRVREIVEGSDGYLYFSTSNRDGRGTIRAGDDRIYRIVPAN